MSDSLIRHLVQTCTACPSQWVGSALDGREFSVRYRWGVLSILIDGENVFEREVGEKMSGLLEEPEMLPYLIDALRIGRDQTGS